MANIPRMYCIEIPQEVTIENAITLVYYQKTVIPGVIPGVILWMG